MSDGCDYATLGGASSLVRIQSGYTQCRIESLELTERVLPGCWHPAPARFRAVQAGDVGVSGNALAMTRFTFFISSIRCVCVVSRPAVSARTTFIFARPGCLHRIEITAAESPPCCEMTATLLRSPQIISCSRAAARNVSPAASNTDKPCACRYFASLPC